ncbi:hypothetical protein JKP10_12700 [Vibrio vulnificus]|uniref:hypothetical protein n=1 Tax=Vibrio vulnificus TaxID=672 RepID=UPI001A1DC5E7|nr:hypothetical protein [Vibrio vulnificus]EJO2020450.1 hypothetical protein [Vibrio vulnificus]EJR3607528.1 hypothetical protein [Vibrio vulnificus]EJV9308317.1 hypothetical protein [Vibrio vulnificus]ELH9600840.1 hypothetical protein [Vibrio vulnificus]ELH9615298.1 hypothetical protein [Vibrio vulnificus]
MELIISGVALIVATLSLGLFILSFTDRNDLTSKLNTGFNSNKKIFTQDGMVASREQLKSNGPLLLIGDSKVTR